MNASAIARELLQLNGLPRHIIQKIESILAGYELPNKAEQHEAFDDLLHNFLFLYYKEGSNAVAIFDSYLIK